METAGDVSEQCTKVRFLRPYFYYPESRFSLEFRFGLFSPTHPFLPVRSIKTLELHTRVPLFPFHFLSRRPYQLYTPSARGTLCVVERARRPIAP